MVHGWFYDGSLVDSQQFGSPLRCLQAMSAYQAAGDRLGEAPLTMKDHRFWQRLSTTKHDHNQLQCQAIPVASMFSNMFKQQVWWFSDVFGCLVEGIFHQVSPSSSASAGCDWISFLSKRCNYPEHWATINHRRPSFINGTIINHPNY